MLSKPRILYIFLNLFTKFNNTGALMLYPNYLIVMFTDIDDLIAKHVAHLFIRDPVSLFSEKINQDDETDTDHFEVSYLPSYAGLMSESFQDYS